MAINCFILFHSRCDFPDLHLQHTYIKKKTQCAKWQTRFWSFCHDEAFPLEHVNDAAFEGAADLLGGLTDRPLALVLVLCQHVDDDGHTTFKKINQT